MNIDATQSPLESAIPRRRWGIALLLGVGILISYVDRVNLSVSREALHDTFGISASTFGWLLSAYSWTYAMLQLPSGVLLDRFGVRLVSRVSIFLWSVASFAAAISPGLASFFGARFLLGVGEAATFPANAKATSYWFPVEERGLATAIFDSSAKLASAIGVPLLGVLMFRFGWRISFAATGALSLAYFLVFSLVYRNPSQDKHLSARERAFIAQGGARPEGAATATKGASIAYLVRHRKVIGASIGFASYNYTFYLLLTWLPSYLSSAMHIDMVHSAVYTGVPWMFAFIVEILVGGWLVDALVQSGRNANRVRQAVLVGGTSLGLGILGAAFSTSTALALFWISISIGGLSAAAAVAWSIPGLIAPRESVGSVGGIMNFANQLTAAIAAPIVTGYIFERTHSFAWAFGVAAIYLAIGVASYIFLLGNIEPIAEPLPQPI